MSSASSTQLGQVINCSNEEEWYDQIAKTDYSELVVVDFTAKWCRPCRFISPILADFARRFPKVIFLKVDVDVVKTIAEKYSVEAMPTFVFLKNGQEVDRIVGARKDVLLERIRRYGPA